MHVSVRHNIGWIPYVLELYARPFAHVQLEYPIETFLVRETNKRALEGNGRKTKRNNMRKKKEDGEAHAAADISGSLGSPRVPYVNLKE